MDVLCVGCWYFYLNFFFFNFSKQNVFFINFLLFSLLIEQKELYGPDISRVGRRDALKGGNASQHSEKYPYGRTRLLVDSYLNAVGVWISSLKPCENRLRHISGIPPQWDQKYPWRKFLMHSSPNDFLTLNSHNSFLCSEF